MSLELRPPPTSTTPTTSYAAWLAIPDPVAVVQDISLGVQRLLYPDGHHVPRHFQALAIIVAGGMEGVAHTCEVSVSEAGRT